MSANDHFEFITVTASAYDAATLATKLTAHSAEGWEVVAIVPAGGELTAFCRRPASGVIASSTASAPVVVNPVAEPVASSPEPAPRQESQEQQASATPAGWYADPSGRYELRYWDGTAWTEHVARGGQQYTDPPVA